MAHITEQAKAFLSENRFAVLATLNQDGTVQQTTMWYLLEEDGTILMNTKAGRLKDRNLRRNPHISICVEDGYRYVTISGQAELIDEPEIAQGDARRLATRYQGAEQAEQRMASQFSKEQRITIRLKTERVWEYF